MEDRDPVIVSAVRTPIGDFGGSLRDLPHTKLAALVMGEVCKRVNFPRRTLTMYTGAWSWCAAMRMD